MYPRPPVRISSLKSLLSVVLFSLHFFSPFLPPSLHILRGPIPESPSDLLFLFPFNRSLLPPLDAPGSSSTRLLAVSRPSFLLHHHEVAARFDEHCSSALLILFIHFLFLLFAYSFNPASIPRFARNNGFDPPPSPKRLDGCSLDASQLRSLDVVAGS